MWKTTTWLLADLLRPNFLVLFRIWHTNAGAINNDKPMTIESTCIYLLLKSCRGMLEYLMKAFLIELDALMRAWQYADVDELGKGFDLIAA